MANHRWNDSAPGLIETEGHIFTHRSSSAGRSVTAIVCTAALTRISGLHGQQQKDVINLGI